ncbi:MAG: hypothetical protein GX950_00910 [Candidatus Diapherotrites archaeon]|jgi:hypothetical protein|uniref:Uncharacterized protein n=1 Tax=Candidatus Iainarchaeum sp. TaxID=3101447 RepID=A0A7K4BZ53_9ARCH|nr:hypothetical protein [Candidatus Diapherotrites archaeon]
MVSKTTGSFAFLIGIILAVLLAIVGVLMPGVIDANLSAILMLILVILGLIVGILNVKDKHITDFLIATMAVALVGNTAGGLLVLDTVILPVGSLLVAIVMNIVALVAPAALVLGLKQVWTLAKE